MKFAKLTLALLTGVIAAAAWSTAHAQCGCAAGIIADPVLLAGGPDTPFPWTTTVPFPWAKMQGVWETTDASSSSLFSFELQTDDNGRKVLKVLEVRAADHVVVAQGIGIEIEENMVRAAMTGQYGSYMLFVGAYKSPKGSQKPVTVLTVRSFSTGLNSPDIQLVAHKISDSPLEGSDY